MKANNITISIPTPPCEMKCPFCISDMTFPVKDNTPWFEENLNKAVKLAERLGVSHCLVTSKGEPTDNVPILKQVLHTFKDFSTELQTNGNNIHDINVNSMLKNATLNVLAISINNPLKFTDLKYWDILKNTPWTIRATIVYTDKFIDWKLIDFIIKCKELNIRQLTIRVPSIPKKLQNTKIAHKTAKWIKNHTNNISLRQIAYDLKQLESVDQAHFIRDLQFGAKIYDVMGIGFTIMEHCIEEQNNDTIRSLVYQSDGHMYTTWGHPGSILF